MEGPRESNEKSAPVTPIEAAFSAGLKGLDSGNAHFIRSQLLTKMQRIAKNGGGETEITHALSQYKEFLTEQATKNLIVELTKAVTELSQELKKQSDQKAVEKGPSILAGFDIQPGTIFYTSNNEPVVIQKIDAAAGIVEVINSKGKHFKYKAENKLAYKSQDGTPDVSHLVLKNDQRTVNLALAYPMHESLEGIDYGTEEKHISINTGETFLDSKGNQWKIGKILYHGDDAIVQVENKDGERRHVMVHEWEKMDEQETLWLMGNRMVLTRTVEPSEPLTQEVPGKEVGWKNIRLTSGEESFMLERGKTYYDDDNIPWTITVVQGLPDGTYTIQIESSGKTKTITATSWDAYTESVVVTDVSGEEHHFSPTEVTVYKKPDQDNTPGDLSTEENLEIRKGVEIPNWMPEETEAISDALEKYSKLSNTQDPTLTGLNLNRLKKFGRKNIEEDSVSNPLSGYEMPEAAEEPQTELSDAEKKRLAKIERLKKLRREIDDMLQ